MNVASYGTTAVAAPKNLAHDQQPNLVAGSNPAVLKDIYEPKTNIAIWQRSLSDKLQCLVGEFVESRQQPYTSVICTPASARSQMLKEFGSSDFSELVDDVNELIDMFCCLFEPSRFAYDSFARGDVPKISCGSSAVPVGDDLWRYRNAVAA